MAEILASDPGAPYHFPMPESASEPRPLPYQERIRDYLKTEEADLWKWFSSKKFLAEYADRIRLEILKSAYRLDRGTHGALYAQADDALRKLGLEVPVTLYQSQINPSLNAALSYLPGECHLIFSGPVLEAMTPHELGWVLGHEFSHFLLFERWSGEFLVADQLLEAMAAHRGAEPAHRESGRLFRLYAEIFCDRSALACCGDPLPAVAALVKIQTGLKEVNAASYLKQAEEIFSKEKVRTEELSHPEAYIRARALKLWADRGAEAEPEIRRTIEGPPALDRLDLLAQRDLAGLTRVLLSAYFADPALRSEALLVHARRFFSDFTPADAPDPFQESLASADPSVQRYAAYVLLDLAAADPDLGEAPLAASTAWARKLGIEERFLEIAAKELKLKKKKAR